MAYKKNLYIDQGSDYVFDATLTDDDDNYLDLTGFNITGQIRKTYHSRVAYDFITEIQEHDVKFILPASVSDEMEPGRYVYDIEVTDSYGKTTRLVEGIVHINPSVTR